VADLYDLLNLGRVDAAAMKKILADGEKLAVFGLTGAQQTALKNLKAENINPVIDAIEKRLRSGRAAGTNVCPSFLRPLKTGR
jgi:hypothetical protein